MGEEEATTTTEVTQKKQQPLFRDINADDDEPEITEIESLCLNCEEQGTTRLLLTKIPLFKDIIIMSFDCPECGYKDNQIRPGGEIQEKGSKITLKVDGAKMMNRQIVRQGSAMVRIEELDFEGPPFTSKGSLTTVEGILENAASGLEMQQSVRRIMHPELAEKIDEIIATLTKYRSGEIPFTLILDDVSGNSFIENPFAPDVDPAMTTEHYVRSKEQDEKLGLSAPPEEEAAVEEEENKVLPENLVEEVLEFPGNCESCQTPNPMRMKVINIPHFKEVILMAISCDACGYKNSEVKAGGAIEPLGVRITFEITDTTDMERDVLVSESCNVEIPELELSLSNYSMGGRFTTLEGLLVYIKERLGMTNPFAFGDSAGKSTKLNELLVKLDRVIAGESFVTVVLDDPIGNSYLQNTYAPDPDPHLKIEKYQRTDEQNEEYGITDMRTENYDEEEEK